MGILNNLIIGISLGSIYAIIALGYTMVYGIAKMLNFAHGDVIMVGGYVSFCVVAYLELPAWLSVLIAMAACTVLGVVIEGLAYRPLRQATSLAVLITAIGVSYFLQNAAQLIWSPTPKYYTAVVSGSLELFGGQLRISAVSLLTVGACIVIMAALTAFINLTRLGKAMRACSENKDAAQLMGINVNATISITPATGSMPGIKAFTAAVFGGIGSVPGAFLGGILLGVIETFARAYISTSLANSIVFAVLIVVLLVRPAGLLGKYVPEKV